MRYVWKSLFSTAVAAPIRARGSHALVCCRSQGCSLPALPRRSISSVTERLHWCRRITRTKSTFNLKWHNLESLKVSWNLQKLAFEVSSFRGLSLDFPHPLTCTSYKPARRPCSSEGPESAQQEAQKHCFHLVMWQGISIHNRTLTVITVSLI